MSKRKKINSTKKQKKFGAPFLISISFIGLLLLVIVVMVDSHINQPQNRESQAAGCTPDAKLVNPCRPWIGTVAGGDPKAGSDPISQFNFFEQQAGHPMDVFHDYHPVGNLPLNSTEIYFAKRPNTYIYINWKPASNWVDADGGNATVNADIVKVADNIKAIAPNKVFLTIYHEPENDVSPGTSSCPGLKGSAGSPAQYRAMWQNVENQFNAQGVDNVVWVMNYMGYSAWDCLVPQMWPGNNLVDWVAFDTYATDSTPTWAGTVGRFYNVLQNDESSTTDFTSKPWAAGEFGTCFLTNESNAYTYFNSIKQAIDANTYPRIKMYLYFGTNIGPGAGMGCLTDYSPSGAYDQTKQNDWNQVANDSIFSQTPTPVPTTVVPTAKPAAATAVPTAKPAPTSVPNVPVVTTTQLLKNGSFESGLNYWLLNAVSPATASINTTTSYKISGSYSAVVNVGNANSNSWYIQFKQRNLPLKAGKTYTVTFWAKAATSRQIQSVLQDVGTHTVYASHAVSLSTNWQKFSYTYKATSSTTNAFLGFNLAQKVGKIWFDTISLTSN